MHRGEWQQALNMLLSLGTEEGFERARQHLWCARALCSLGRYPEAVEQARQSIRVEARASPSIARYRGILIARASRRIAHGQVSAALLWQLLKQEPDSTILQLQYSEQALKTLGDWRPVHQIVLDKPRLETISSRTGQWLAIRSRIYEGRTTPDQQLVDMGRFADKYLTLQEVAGKAKKNEQLEIKVSSRGRRVRRIGVISSLFCVGPVFFMGIGALTRLANTSRLVFFSRQHTVDWASEELNAIAHEWIDVSHLNPIQLADKIRRTELDIVIDMAGLMDLDVLKALSSKPAKKQYKWVGGQFYTTGLRCFDAFITDEVQSPIGSERYHTEKLVRLKSGYVTYTPPPYTPKPEKPLTNESRRVGVIAHPIKVVEVYLEFLRKEILRHQTSSELKIDLCFVGGRYGNSVVQQRIQKHLMPTLDQDGSSVQIRFTPTTGHKNHLQEVGRLDWIIDTFPFSGGLTTLEALALGVPVRTYAGKTFQERHGVAH